MRDGGQLRYDLINTAIARVNDDRSLGLDQRSIVARLVKAIPFKDVALDSIPTHLLSGVCKLQGAAFDTDGNVCVKEEA